jgi:two-component system sensor histidine kinase YesM
MVPKIILQPIVENSIYHGIRKLSKNGLIKISTSLKEDYIYFVIEDNGVGFDIKETSTKKTSTKLGGVGIKNVDERIKLYYGDNCGIIIESNKSKGTKVILKLYKNHL